MKKILVIIFIFTFYAGYSQIKISQLSAASTVNSTDLFLLTQGASSKKLTFESLQSKMFNPVPYALRLNYSSDSIRVELIVDSVKFITNQSYFAFSKPLYIQGSLLTSFPGFGTSHSTSAYGDHNHSGTYATPAQLGDTSNTLRGLINEKLSTSGTAANSSLLQDKDSVYIKANWGISGLTDNILDYDSDLKTFKRYTTKTVGGLYKHADNPDGTDSLKFNGRFFATDIRATNTYYGTNNGKVIDITGSNSTVYAANVSGGIDVTSAQNTKYALYVRNNATGSGTYSGTLLRIDRDYGGTADLTGDIFVINDSPSTSGSVSGSSFKIITGGTDRVIFNPRATRGNHLFDTKDVVDDTASLVIVGNAGTTKIKLKGNGDINARYIHSLAPNAYSFFADSTITISLTQNVWIQLTRPVTKTTWPDVSPDGFTEDGDTIISTIQGYYNLNYIINLTDVDTKEYECRIMRKTDGGVTAEAARFAFTGTGKKKIIPIPTFIDLADDYKFWIEIRSTSATPGDVTLHGGQMRIHPIYLN